MKDHPKEGQIHLKADGELPDHKKRPERGIEYVRKHKAQRFQQRITKISKIRVGELYFAAGHRPRHKEEGEQHQNPQFGEHPCGFG